MALATENLDALNILDDDFADYTPGDNRPFGDEYEKSVRPSIADKLVVGFMASDQCTQTDISEILDIKQITASATMLEEEMGSLKRNFKFTKQVLNAAFEQSLQCKALELYTKLNDRLKDVELIHRERVEVVRRSFKQQLQDALILMATKYKKHYEAKLSGKLQPEKPSGAKMKAAALQQELSRAQSVIQMMEVQIEQLKADLESKPTVTEIQIDTTEIDELTAQNNSLTAELAMINDRVDELTDSLEFRDEKIKQLSSTIADGEAMLSKEKQAAQKLAMNLEQVKKELESFKLDSARALDKQRFQMEADMANKLADSASAAADAARQQEEMAKKMESELQRRMLEEKRKHELQIAQLRADAEQANSQVEDVQNLQRIINEQKQQISVYQQRLVRINSQWEKKFNILRASLHALKDESYVRLQLQKQAATLKYASISYGPDGPQEGANISATPPSPSRQKAFPPTKPLPSLRKGSHMQVMGKKTNTIPSGIGTEPFSEDEEEEDEEEMEDFVPLPPKPNVGNFMPAIA